MIKKLPASPDAPSMQVIGAKINELVDKANELDICIEKIIHILTDMTIFHMMRAFKDKKDDLK